MAEKLNRLFEILGYQLEEYGCNRWKATACGYRYLLIHKNNDRKFTITAYLPGLNEPGLRHNVVNYLYKKGGFDIEKRDLRSLKKDIERRVLIGYEEAIENNLNMLYLFRKQQIENKKIKDNVKNFLVSQGFRADPGGDFMCKGNIDITTYNATKGTLYQVKLPFLEHQDLVELAVFLSKRNL